MRALFSTAGKIRRSDRDFANGSSISVRQRSSEDFIENYGVGSAQGLNVQSVGR